MNSNIKNIWNAVLIFLFKNAAIHDIYYELDLSKLTKTVMDVIEETMFVFDQSSNNLPPNIATIDIGTIEETQAASQNSQQDIQANFRIVEELLDQTLYYSQVVL
jgi:hypothetical protein